MRVSIFSVGYWIPAYAGMTESERPDPKEKAGLIAGFFIAHIINASIRSPILIPLRLLARYWSG
jgi:hypothetical protein